MTSKKTNVRAKAPSLETGLRVLRENLKTMPGDPGVYRMLNEAGEALYVGKAKNLKKRVVSYTRLNALPNRLKRMVASTKALEIITTHTEAEALLLEANLIKKLKPRYNVVLRDDKSFPHILLRTDHKWAQIKKHRGAQKRIGDYFGPFASVGAVNRTLNTLQKIFLLRSCSDSVFNSRTRPCLLFQIKRCSGPCVGKISENNYKTLVTDARNFLSGKKTDIQKRLAKEMERASENLEYERAAAFRDRLEALTRVQAKQNVNATELKDADVIALHQIADKSCVQVFFFRGGQNWGNRSYFPRHSQDETPNMVLGAFIGQFYANKPPPGLLLTNVRPESKTLIEKTFSEKTGRKVQVVVPTRGKRQALVREAEVNARGALERKLAENTAQEKAIAKLETLFKIDGPIERIEVYDNSHLSGKNQVGAMISAGPEGFLKNNYRKFNIKNKDLAPGDDYGMMREVFTRRFSKLQKEDPDREQGTWPDLVLIDGGAGQLSSVHRIMNDLGLEDLPIVAISKGPDRHAGREQLHIQDKRPFTLPPNSPELYFLQRLRDEAHRFAISSHRVRRKKQTLTSPLDEIPGIGPSRKKALLNHFGSAAAIKDAGVQDLQAVEGVSKVMAENIYNFFHEAG